MERDVIIIPLEQLLDMIGGLSTGDKCILEDGDSILTLRGCFDQLFFDELIGLAMQS